MGLVLLLSSLSAYLRDLKDLVQLFCFVNIYLMPVVYLPTWVPGKVRVHHALDAPRKSNRAWVVHE